MGQKIASDATTETWRVYWDSHCHVANTQTIFVDDTYQGTRPVLTAVRWSAPKVEIVKVESANPVANPVQIQRAVARTTAQDWAAGTKVYWFITDRMLVDMDGDGRTDTEEMVGPTQFLTDPTNADTDGDGVPDGGLKLDLNSGAYDDPTTGCQNDAGPDGKPDCPDQDGDGLSAAADTPTDMGMSDNQDLSGDGSSHRRLGFKIVTLVGKDIEPNGGGKDNCPSIPNADQLNTDYDTSLVFNPNATLLGNGDLYGDACDSDADQDSFVDVAETNFQWDAGAHQCSNDKDLPGPPTTPALNSPNLDPDSDNDGVLDGRECEVGTNPTDQFDSPGTPGAANDPDKDGVSNTYETARRTQSFSGTASEDVDGDTLVGQMDPDSDFNGASTLSDGCESYVTGTSPLSTDTDWDGVLDTAEVGAAARAAIYCASATDLDGDSKTNEQDNCLFVDNGPSDPSNQVNTNPAIGNGKGVTGDDSTVPWSVKDDKRGDACDGDIDNDGLRNASDSETGAGPGNDITYDDPNNAGDGAWRIAPDDGPSWDINPVLGNSRLDGRETLCAGSFSDMPAGWASADSDGDGLLNKWEFCKWGSSPLFGRSDSDGDSPVPPSKTKGDCVEAADVDGNGNVDFTGDVMLYAQAILLTPCPGATCFGQDGDFDIDANNNLDFTGDVMMEAQFGLIGTPGTSTGMCH
jgi:hypothetical protein